MTFTKLSITILILNRNSKYHYRKGLDFLHISPQKCTTSIRTELLSGTREETQTKTASRTGKEEERNLNLGRAVKGGFRKSSAKVIGDPQRLPRDTLLGEEGDAIGG